MNLGFAGHRELPASRQIPTSERCKSVASNTNQSSAHLALALHLHGSLNSAPNLTQLIPGGGRNKSKANPFRRPAVRGVQSARHLAGARHFLAVPRFNHVPRLVCTCVYGIYSTCFSRFDFSERTNTTQVAIGFGVFVFCSPRMSTDWHDIDKISFWVPVSKISKISLIWIVDGTRRRNREPDLTHLLQVASAPLVLYIPLHPNPTAANLREMRNLFKDALFQQTGMQLRVGALAPDERADRPSTIAPGSSGVHLAARDLVLILQQMGVTKVR